MSWKKGNRLRIVSEQDAAGRTREIFDEIKSTLGVPHVGLVFQAYATFPAFLEAHWARLRPVVERQEFLSLAARLRADAYTRMHNYFDIPDLKAQAAGLGISDGPRRELCYAVELFHHSNPLELLVVAAQWQAFDGRVGQESAAASIASGPLFTNCPILIGEETASPPVRKLYEDVRRTLAVPQVAPAFQAMARWPEFLRLYWDVLKGILQSPMYQESIHGIYGSAWTLAHELPGTVELTPDQLVDIGMQDQDVVSVVRITELFVRVASGLALNLAVAKIGLEGGNRAQLCVGERAGKPQQAA